MEKITMEEIIKKDQKEAQGWLTVEGNSDRLFLRRAASKIAEKWPGRYRFRIVIDSLPANDAFELQLRHA